MRCFGARVASVRVFCARVEGTLATRRAAEQHFGLGSKFARHSCAANLCTGSRKVCASLLQTHAGFAAAVRFYILLVHGICRCVVCGWTSGPTLPFCVRDSLAEWSKALAPGASPQGRGFEPHSCHLIAPPGAQCTVWLYNRCCHDVAIAEVRCRGVCVRRSAAAVRNGIRCACCQRLPQPHSCHF